MERRWGAIAGVLKRVVLLHSSRTLSPSSPSLYHTIQAIPREYTGSRIAARDRAQGRIPTVVFAQDQHDPIKPISKKHLLTTERKQINSILKSVELPFFCSTTFQLQIRAGAGSSHLLDSGTVLPIKIHRDPATGNILNLVLVWANEGSELNIDVPIAFKGEELAPGLKKGHGHLIWKLSVEARSDGGRLHNPIFHQRKKESFDFSCSLPTAAGSGGAVDIEEVYEVSGFVVNPPDTRKEDSLAALVLEDRGPSFLPTNGTSSGGYLQKIRSHLKFQSPVEHIPSKIEADISKLDVGDKLYAHDLELHPSLKLLTTLDKIPLCKVLGSKPRVSKPKTVKIAEESEPVAA